MNECALVRHCDFLGALRRYSALDAVESQELVALFVEYLEEAKRPAQIFQLEGLHFWLGDYGTAKKKFCFFDDAAWI